MTETSDFRSEYRSFAATMAHVFEPLMSRLMELKSAIVEEHPQWQREGSDFKEHEARREWLVTILITLETARLSYVLLRDHATDDGWWDERFTAVSESKRKSVLDNYAMVTKWAFLHGVFMAVEETLRSIQRAAPGLFPVNRQTISSITSSILNVSDLDDLNELFRLIRLTRNTVHTNGIFLPDYNTDDDSVTYGGQTFEFRYGMGIDWLTDQRAVWFIEQIIEAMAAIIRSETVAGIDYCPRGLLP
jgi:hypothetical protein